MKQMKEKAEVRIERKEKCASCGSESDKLYQQNLCKKCVLSSFERLIPMINEYRMRA